MPFKRYTKAQLESIVTLLQNIRDEDGEPVFSVVMEGPYPDRKTITFKNWGTTAHLEFHVQRWEGDQEL